MCMYNKNNPSSYVMPTGLLYITVTWQISYTLTITTITTVNKKTESCQVQLQHESGRLVTENDKTTLLVNNNNNNQLTLLYITSRSIADLKSWGGGQDVAIFRCQLQISNSRISTKISRTFNVNSHITCVEK